MILLPSLMLLVAGVTVVACVTAAACIQTVAGILAVAVVRVKFLTPIYRPSFLKNKPKMLIFNH
jgi:hypothetical protein